jgi:hypothetical protein
MRHRQALRRSLAALGFLISATAPAAGFLKVYLRFAPQESLNSDPPKLERANLARPIRLGEIVDRSGGNPLRISQTPSVLAGNPVPEFVSSALSTCLTAWGVRLSTDADVTLRGEIATFTADEGNRYNAEINIRFQLETKEGGPPWEGAATGHASTWGRSMSAGNYNQVLSDAMRLLAADLAVKPSLSGGVGRTSSSDVDRSRGERRVEGQDPRAHEKRSCHRCDCRIRSKSQTLPTAHRRPNPCLEERRDRRRRDQSRTTRATETAGLAASSADPLIPERRAATITVPAKVAELVDAQVSGTCG